MNLVKLFTLGLVAILTGCSTLSQEMNCNKTAGDSCLTMDAVNALTEPKSMYTKKSIIIAPKTQSSGGIIWLAPFTDAAGRHHQEQTIELSRADGVGGDDA